MGKLRRFTDGVLFQAVLTGSLSFSHIHDLAAGHGQDGWKAWLYPLSVDLLTVAAYRKIVAKDSGSKMLAWLTFLLGLAASLAANIVSSWDNKMDRPLAVCLGVWPAVAFLACTLLSHRDESAPAVELVESVEAEQSAVAPVPPTVPATPVQAASQPAVLALPAAPAEAPSVAPALLDWARTIADEYERVNGEPIDTAALRTKLRISEPLAHTIHTHLYA
ncbi:DUF2637 domain-containing protein [Catenulispora rubra]|uniref:DUF2637 domain-containing protein n=1 Tax=Catenulispora rubra TaxID=280293 RepID=UPI00189243FF|nr:DUF2637 domain-containing protein [Catenulispora rubra]